jgi:membrane protease YdiL (CAAX protease family)
VFDLAHLPRITLFAALAIILVVAPLVSALLAKRGAQGGARAKHARYARTMLILWSMTALALWALRLHGQGPADIGLVPPRDPIAAYGAVLAFVVGLTVLGLMSGGSTDQTYAERIRRVAPLTPGDWFWYVPVALTAGVCEEFLYRGYAITVLSTLTGSLAVGIVVSTAAFGLAHAYQGRRGIVGTAIFGLFFALVFVYWGSLWPCIAGHALQDLIGGALVARRLAATPAPSEPTNVV